MRSIIRTPLAALFVSAACLASVAVAGAQTTAAPATPSAPSEASQWMQRFTETREAMLDARLAGLKAGLKLTADQEALWGPFEAAVRDFAHARMARMQSMMERMEGDDEEAGPPPSPIDRIDHMATRLSDVGASLRKIADAGKPLYASFDEQQKQMFGFLSREMMKMGRGHGDMGEMMGQPSHHHHGDEDNSDDEQ